MRGGVRGHRAHLAEEFAGIVETLHAFVAADWRLGVVTSKARRPGGPAPRAPRVSLRDHSHARRRGPDEAGPGPTPPGTGRPGGRPRLPPSTWVTWRSTRSRPPALASRMYTLDGATGSRRLPPRDGRVPHGTVEPPSRQAARRGEHGVSPRTTGGLEPSPLLQRREADLDSCRKPASWRTRGPTTSTPRTWKRRPSTSSYCAPASKTSWRPSTATAPSWPLTPGGADWLHVQHVPDATLRRRDRAQAPGP